MSCMMNCELKINYAHNFYKFQSYLFCYQEKINIFFPSSSSLVCAICIIRSAAQTVFLASKQALRNLATHSTHEFGPQM